jgi:rhodanese-related sulfurtransferase
MLDDMVRTVTPDDLADLVSRQVVDLVDVRDPDEWNSGHIDGARHLPLEQMRADPDAALGRDIATVFICAKGVRSMQAAKIAERFGRDQVFTLEGGTKGWLRAGKPLVANAARAAA